jgi:hypothetical protein
MSKTPPPQPKPQPEPRKPDELYDDKNRGADRSGSQ